MPIKYVNELYGNTATVEFLANKRWSHISEHLSKSLPLLPLLMTMTYLNRDLFPRLCAVNQYNGQLAIQLQLNLNLNKNNITYTMQSSPAMHYRLLLAS